jgi:hypothetical protein
MTNPGMAESPGLTHDEIAAAGAVATTVPDTLRASFDGRLAAWKATWTRPELQLSSDTRDFTRGPEFEAIVELGPAAAPLVAEQLAREPDGFFLLAVLERWLDREDLVATTRENPLESQQSRARRALRELMTS